MFWTKKKCKGLWGSRCINKRHALFVGSAGCGLSEDLTFEQAVKGRRHCWRPNTQSGRIEIQMQAGWSQVLFMFLKTRIWSSDLGPSATSHTLLLGPWAAWWGRGPSVGVNWWCRARCLLCRETRARSRLLAHSSHSLHGFVWIALGSWLYGVHRFCQLREKPGEANSKQLGQAK